MPSNNVTVTSNWSYNNSGGGSTGGNSSTSGENITSQATPEPPSIAEINAKMNTNKDGSIRAKVDDKEIVKAIEKAQKSEKQNGTAIRLNVKGKENATSLKVTLSEAAVAALRTAKVTQFTIQNGLTTITFDLTALNALAGDEVNLNISKVDVKSLSAQARRVIGNRPVFRFGATVGDRAVTEFKGARVGLQMPYTSSSTEQAGNLCVVFVDNNGKVTWLENSSYDPIASKMLASTTYLSVYGIGYKQGTSKFTDVSTHWAKNDIDFVVARGLLSGTNATTFAPDQSITRGRFVTALGRLAGIDTKKYQQVTFTDVKADAYYFAYATWASVNGIVPGTSDTTFSPNSAITRQEMAVMLVNYSKAIGYKLPSVHAEVRFVDASNIPSWAKDAVKKGESFWSIAWKYKVSMFELAKVNGKNIFSAIRPREELKIPQ